MPYVKLSDKKNQKSVIGVISNKQQKLIFDNTIEINNNSLNNQIIINSLGEGAIWVSNYNRDLSNGDYITTSDIPGISMKQDGDLLHNYTVAKITCECDFDLNTDKYECIEFVDTTSGNTYRKALVGCTYHCG